MLQWTNGHFGKTFWIIAEFTFLKYIQNKVTLLLHAFSLKALKSRPGLICNSGGLMQKNLPGLVGD